MTANIFAPVRAYQRLLLVAFSLSPVPLILYLQHFQNNELLFRNFFAHELAIGAAVILSIGITLTAAHCYRDSGEPTLRWLTLGMLGMTIIYAPHGVLTRLAADNPPMFLLFGPASRFAIGFFWVLAFSKMKAPTEPPEARASTAWWWRWVLVFLMIDGLILVFASDHSMPRMQARIILETGAIACNLACLTLLLKTSSESPLLRYFSVGLCFFILASISFFLSSPWNHIWWLAHAIFAAGFSIMSFGIARAYLSTGKLVNVFSEEELISRLSELATTDELTSLPNRRHFMEQFDRKLLDRSPDPFALVLVDLDNFKAVNDSLGHKAGDELLITIAKRLEQALRPQDVVGRLGGDEFAILLSSVSTEAETSHILNRLLETLSRPFFFQEKRLQPGASLGVALYLNDGDTRESLFKAADAALYKSKDQGRNQYTFHTAQMNQEALKRLRVENELRLALQNNELQLYYQPQVDLKTRRVFGVEALLRWQHPEQGLLPAKDFIEIAEASGLIHDVGDFVLQEVCKDMQEFQARFDLPFQFAINLSGHQLIDASTYSKILETLDSFDIDKNQLKLELEVTERSILKTAEMTDVLTRLDKHGIQLAIDDFGSGYSSLAQLHDLPVDRLKISRRFVIAMEESPHSQSIVNAMVRLGLDLGISVLAEGVETQAQIDMLTSMGCEAVQGYFFHRPLERKDMLELVNSQTTTA